MKGVLRRCSIIIASLLFFTLVVLAAAAIAEGGGGDKDDASTVEEAQRRHHPLADEPYLLLLVTFKNKDGEEIRLVADKWSSEGLSASGIANRSGSWFNLIRVRGGNDGKRHRRRLTHVTSGRTAEGLWNALGALASTATATDGGGGGERYVLVGMETSGGHKIRFVAVADQRYASITGFAQGFSDIHVRWSFRDGERHRLHPTFDDGSSASHGGSSHAEVVASNLLAALGKEATSS